MQMAINKAEIWKGSIHHAAHERGDFCIGQLSAQPLFADDFYRCGHNASLQAKSFCSNGNVYAGLVLGKTKHVFSLAN